MIPSVGKPKILYQDHKNIKFESLDFYINLAKKIISKMAPTFFSGLSKEMLKNEDAISFVANAIMMGDWRWKKDTIKDNSNEEKQYKTLYSYRNQCGIWAIQTYVTKRYKQNNSSKKIKEKYSINYTDDNDVSLESVIADHSQIEPVDKIIEEEKNNNIKSLIEQLFNTDILSDKQKDQVKMYYYDNMTLEQIGRVQGVTREAVRQSIKTAISKIRTLI
jgi:RNA polymerase sigma factor (sigma-70 family)